jgi:hypothetical protein
MEAAWSASQRFIHPAHVLTRPRASESPDRVDPPAQPAARREAAARATAAHPTRMAGEPCGCGHGDSDSARGGGEGPRPYAREIVADLTEAAARPAVTVGSAPCVGGGGRTS